MADTIIHQTNQPLAQTDKQRLDGFERNVSQYIQQSIAASEQKIAQYIQQSTAASEQKIAQYIQQSTAASEQKIAQYIQQSTAASEQKIAQYVQQSTAASEQKIAQYVQQSIAASEQKIAQYVQQSIAASEQKVDTKLPQLIRQHTDNLKQAIMRLESDCEKSQNNVNLIQQNIRTINSGIQSTAIELSGKINDLEAKLKDIEKILSNSSATSSQNVNTAPPVRDTSNNKTVSDFNTWASNPNNRLPYGFYYIAGDVQIRKEQEFKKSNSETKWITNESGGKFLFPNPNLFNLTTNINELYKMEQSRLKQRDNKIIITKPCEIEDNGFINYPGELDFV